VQVATFKTQELAEKNEHNNRQALGACVGELHLILIFCGS
jgi:hypothetical protein